jgi:hypothetical protein
MFNLFKKKKKEEKKISVTPISKSKNKPEHEMPMFGTADHFMKTYITGEQHIAIGKSGEDLVTATANSEPINDIIVINDDWTSVIQQCIVPTITQRRLSYVVYDPNGDCYARVGSAMKARGYDVQLVDLEDEENLSRVDLFEVANITKSPYWTSIMLTGAIRCEQNEIVVAHSLLMAMMLYSLELDQRIDIKDMVALFDRIKANDKHALLEIKSCKDADQYIRAFECALPALRASVMAKVEERFLRPATLKVSHPNILTITAHKKQTIIFIKRVPKQYRYLITALMFNLTASSVLCEGQDVTTLVIDSMSDEWYNRSLLNKICKESGSAMGQKVAYMRIRKSLEDQRPLSADKKQLLIYMHSDSENTKEYIHNRLLIKNQIAPDEQEQISKSRYHGKAIPVDVMNSSSVSIEELGHLNDCVVIDTSKQVRPFRCERLK